MKNAYPKLSPRMRRLNAQVARDRKARVTALLRFVGASSGTTAEWVMLGCPTLPETIAAKLEAHSEPDARGCRLWKGPKTGRGYGNLAVPGWRGQRKLAGTHRLALELREGRRLGPDEHACHTCDVVNCISPAHLFAGTARDNARDCVRKGRGATGERHGRSKLREADVRQILHQHLQGAHLHHLAQEFPQVKLSQIADICRGRSWKRVYAEVVREYMDKQNN